MVFENLATSNGNRKTRGAASETKETTERNLVKAAKSGQSSAFATLCQRHAPQLLRATHRITRNREDSEDAVQDALLRAFVHLGDFDGRSSFATWLTRIAINSALMSLRKKRTWREIAIAGPDDFGADSKVYDIADGAPNPERRYAQDERERILKHAINGLRPTLRQVVEMKQLQERSMQETAEAMSISVAAAKARLFHAKLALRKSALLRHMRRSHRTHAKFRVASAA